VLWGDFEWDEAKASLNAQKHGITFVEAATALDDPDELAFADPVDASRIHSLVMSPRARVLLVVTTETTDRIRIISARKALTHEQRAYSQARD